MKARQVLPGWWLGLLMLLVGLSGGRVGAQPTLGQFISWQGATNEVLFPNTTHPLAASASSGLPVTLKIVSGPAVLGNGTITVTNGGTVLVRAEQAGNQQYYRATDSIVLNRRPVGFTQVGRLDLQVVASGVRVTKNRALVANGEKGLLVVNVVDPTRPTLVKSVSLGGPAVGICLAGDFAYITTLGGMLVVLDVKDPGYPVLLGSVALGLGANQIDVADGFAYIANVSKGMQVINVSDPAHPVKVSELAMVGYAYGVKVADGRAWLAVDGGGLLLIDVAEPSAPRRLCQLGLEASRGLCVSNRIAYVATGSSQVLDVGYLTTSNCLVRANTPAGGPRFPWFEDSMPRWDPTGAYTLSVTLHEDGVLMAGGARGVLAFEVSDPRNPVQMGQSPALGYVQDAQVVGDHVFVADRRGTLQILAMNKGFTNSFDFTPPKEVPIATGHLQLPPTSANGTPVNYQVLSGPAIVSGDRLNFLAAGVVKLRARLPNTGFFAAMEREWTIRIYYEPQTLTWTGATNEYLELNRPHPIGAVTSSGLPVVLRIVTGPATISDGFITVRDHGTVVVSAEQDGGGRFLSIRETKSFNIRQAALTRLATYRSDQLTGWFNQADGIVYLSEGDQGWQMVDVRDPAKPVRAGGSSLPGDATSIQVVGNLAYVPDARTGLEIFDISDPLRPLLLSEYFTENGAYGVVVVGRFAYVAGGEDGLLVIDVSNPLAPKLHGLLDTASFAFALKVVGDFAYVADRGDGVMVISLADPAFPSFANGVRLKGDTTSLDVAGNFLYAATHNHGLAVVDVSNPRAPVLMSETKLDGEVWEVAYWQGLAYLSAGGRGIQVFDVSDPTKPVRVGSTTDLGSAIGVKASGDKVYAIDDSMGLTIFETKLGYRQSLVWNLTTNSIISAGFPQVVQVAASSGLPTTSRVLAGPAVLTNRTLAITGKGTVWIESEQAGDATFAPVKEARPFNARRTQVERVAGVATNVFGFDLDATGNRLYTSGWDGLRVLDVSVPGQAKVLGFRSIWGDSEQVRARDGLAYVGAGWVGLLVIAVDDPDTMGLVGRYSGWVGAFAFDLARTNVYVRSATGVEVLGLENSTNLIWLGAVPIKGEPFGIKAVEGLAYVGSKGRGLRVVDASDPANPFLVVQANNEGNAFGLEIAGAWAFAPAGDEGLRILSLADPRHPKEVGRLATQGPANVATVGEGIAFVGEPTGIELFDVSNPESPFWMGKFETTRAVQTLRRLGDHLYVNSIDGRLQVWKLRSGYAQEVKLDLPASIGLGEVLPKASGSSSSGLPVKLSVVSGPATVENDQLILTGLGQVKLHAEQAGDDDYLPASVDWTITVTPPEVRARLLDGAVELSWAAGIEGMQLQARESLSTEGFWVDVAEQPVMENSEAKVRLGRSERERYFRLIKR